jgi:hypothetical protein
MGQLRSAQPCSWCAGTASEHLGSGASPKSEGERLDLAERLLSSLPADPEWLAELERRARRALADPSGGRRISGA